MPGFQIRADSVQLQQACRCYKKPPTDNWEFGRVLYGEVFWQKKKVGILMMTLDDCKFGSIVNTPKDQNIFYRGKHDTEKQ